MSQRLDSLLERAVYNKPFDGIPTLFLDGDLNFILQCGAVQLVYFGKMRDAHHANDRLIVQSELEALKLPDLFAVCEWDYQNTVAVYGIRRVAALKLPKQYWAEHKMRDGEKPRLEMSEMFGDKSVFPRAVDLGAVIEERDDFEQAMRGVVAFGGVVVGHLYFDTMSSPVEEERAAIVAYIASVVDAKSEFGYFERFEDHGVHGSVFYFILSKDVSNLQ